MVIWGLPKRGSFPNLKTFVETRLWNKSKDVGTFQKTIDFGVEYHRFDLLF